MSNIQIFNNEQFGEVRTIRKDDQIWFVAKDVAEILEYSYTSTATRRLDEDEKGVQHLQTPGGQQEMIIVNEYGLYNLVLGSEKEEAKQFKRWITHDVIPSIRKTGSYSVEQASQFDLLRNMVDEMEQTRKIAEQAKSDVAATEEKVAQIEERTSTEITQADVTASNIAKQLGVTTANGFAHNQLIGEIAKKLGLKTRLKTHYKDDFIKIVPDDEGNGYRCYYRPAGVDKIVGWFEKNKDQIYFEEHYSLGGKYGNKGDLKCAGYKINGVRYKTYSARAK